MSKKIIKIDARITKVGNNPLVDGLKNVEEVYTKEGVDKLVSSTSLPLSGGTMTGNIILATDVKIGIGQSTPMYNLDVTGTGRFTDSLTCQTLVQTSQADQKKDILGITKTKSKIIEFKEYSFISDGASRKRYGVLAEDIENDYPELVYTGPDGLKGVNYIDLLVKRVAELEKELADMPSGGGEESHLSNITSITFGREGELLVTIAGRTNTYISA